MTTIKFNLPEGVLSNKIKLWSLVYQGRSQGGRGEIPPPHETEKNVVEKWCYFRKLYF